MMLDLFRDHQNDTLTHWFYNFRTGLKNLRNDQIMQNIWKQYEYIIQAGYSLF